MYIAVSNPDGIGSSPVVVAHEDPSAATVRTWTQWRIQLQSFSDQGVDLTNVDKLAIGLGSTAGVAAPGGSGTIFVDDVRLALP